MGHADDEFIIEATALLRGDLSDLLPGAWESTDVALCEAMAESDIDLSGAADRVRSLVNANPSLGARLATHQRELREGHIRPDVARDAVGTFTGVLGNPGPVAAVVWTCPEIHTNPYRKRQRFPRQNMGLCSIHEVPLVLEDMRG